MGTGMGIGMWVIWLVGIVAVLLIAKLLLLGPTERSDNSPATALDILQKRYASGEIDADEFERMKKQLVD